MGRFTTEQRRTLTASVLETEKFNTDLSYVNQKIYLAEEDKIKKDKTNREMFRFLNSFLTGLAYEYAYINGKYHARLDETLYTSSNPDSSSAINYYDVEKLRNAAKLTETTEFFSDITRSATSYNPLEPDRYAEWYDDTTDFDTYVFDFFRTEIEQFNAINTLLTYYSSGYTGSSAATTESLVFYDETIATTAQGTMVYATGSVSEGDYILIKEDADNFIFGKIVEPVSSSGDFIIDKYVQVGIPSATYSITGDYTASDDFILTIIEELVKVYKEHLLTLERYLSYNVDRGISGNGALEDVEAMLVKISTWEAAKDTTFTTATTTLISDFGIERNAAGVFSARAGDIDTYMKLAARGTDYTNRFTLIKNRINKKSGTLKDLMEIILGMEEASNILTDKAGHLSVINDYFIVKKIQADGDGRRRVFVIDTTDLSLNDTVYILTDDENVSELECEIDLITDGILDDYSQVYYNNLGNIKREFVDIKKIFFKDNIIVTSDYLMSDNLRLIKEI